jgi:chloramphenicol-sensitive protein RarD|tara:strand:- start:46 stop:918 length:873 start_codon:yes stop_codon:yes gene_type:complete
MNNLNKGILSASFGSFWWGFLGVIYFKYFSFIGHIELVVHRCLWTAFMLILTTIYLSKWKLVLTIISENKNLFILFMTSILIFINWSVWIYAITINRIIDASFGYFIMPIISVLFGFIFFKEKLNQKRIIAIFLVGVSIFYSLYIYGSVPWVGLIVAFSWSFYNLLRKTIDIDTDIGLLIESLFILPFAIIVFYLIFKNNLNNFSFLNPSLSLMLLLAGPMTVIPLYLYVRGVELIGLGATGMIFYITPTLQFILGYFFYNEPFSLEKLISFILIWFAVIIYLKDLYENN